MHKITMKEIKMNFFRCQNNKKFNFYSESFNLMTLKQSKRN